MPIISDDCFNKQIKTDSFRELEKRFRTKAGYVAEVWIPL